MLVFRQNQKPFQKSMTGGSLDGKPFLVWVEGVEFWKSEAHESAHQMRIGGVVSTDRLDLHGERVLQKGLDFSYFLEHGYFNDDHKSDEILGYPSSCRYFEKGQRLPSGRLAKRGCWYVEGYMLDTPVAVKKYDLAKALSKTPRRLGFSVQGVYGVNDKQDGVLRRALVRQVAITHQPVNVDTELEVLAKSLAAGHETPGGEGVPGDGSPLRAQSLEEEDTNGVTTMTDTMKDLVAAQDATVADAEKTLNKSLAGTAPGVTPNANGEIEGEALLKSLVDRQETVLGQSHENSVMLGKILIGQGKLIKSLAERVDTLSAEVRSLGAAPLAARGATTEEMAKSLAARQRTFGNPENLGGGNGGKSIRTQCQEKLDGMLQKSLAHGDRRALGQLENLQAQIESGFASESLLKQIEGIQVLAG